MNEPGLVGFTHRARPKRCQIGRVGWVKPTDERTWIGWFHPPYNYNGRVRYGKGCGAMKTKRLLFASIHSYLDPSSGATMASREVLEVLVARGWDCRALTRGVLDYQRETPLDEVLATLERPARRASAALGRGGAAEVVDLEPGGFYRVSRVVLMPSLWRESLGRVAMEAMANGIPVLAMVIGGSHEALTTATASNRDIAHAQANL
jgi:glycosyltransferase involved in cell wall biosynthesis